MPEFSMKNIDGKSLFFDGQNLHGRSLRPVLPTASSAQQICIEGHGARARAAQ